MNTKFDEFDSELKDKILHVALVHYTCTSAGRINLRNCRASATLQYEEYPDDFGKASIRSEGDGSNIGEGLARKSIVGRTVGSLCRRASNR